MLCVLAVILSGFLALAQPAGAQGAVVPAPLDHPSGAEYSKALRFKGIENGVLYYDPTAPAPDLNTTVKPELPTPKDRPDYSPVAMVVLILVLGGVLALFYFFGRSVSVSFRSSSDDPRRKMARPGSEAVAIPRQATDLQAILAIKDRRAALIRLAHLALTRAVDANGLLFQRSWTQRDALRKLPRDLPYMPQLHALVMESERVHFGGRDISEADFETHVSQIKSLVTAHPG